MGLPWVRLDTNVAAHDKMLSLISDPSPKRWQAASSYFFALAWAGGAGTDGRVPAYALSMVHGNATTARLLVKHGLWAETPSGDWRIRNFEEYQRLAVVSDAKHSAARAAAVKANCVRWHGKDCGCWQQAP